MPSVTARDAAQRPVTGGPRQPPGPPWPTPKPRGCNCPWPMVLLLLLAAAPMHSRLVTEHGPVHVAIPPCSGRSADARGTRAAPPQADGACGSAPRAGAPQVTVVYVHGFWTNVDDAWVQHRLGEQLGGVEAVVIAPEAPSGPGQQVRWPHLDALLKEVEARTGVKLPETVIAIGHSGAYRTLEGWTSDDRVKSVVLLDAFYGSAQPWERFAGDLRIVARHTAKRSAPFCDRHTQVHCETTDLSHMAIVTSGSVIPRVLREAVAAVLPRT